MSDKFHMDDGFGEMVTPQCETCKHRHGQGFTCDAFPDDIPDAILLGDHDHTKPYPGDNGIRYEPRKRTKSDTRFDPDQPRNQDGTWSSDGNGSADSSESMEGFAQPEDSFQGLNRHDEKMIEETKGQWASLSEEEQYIAKEYTGGWHRDMNDMLIRTKGDPDSESGSALEKERVRTLDGAMAKSSLPKATVLYRGTSTKALAAMIGDGADVESLVGKVVKSVSFGSSSTSRMVADAYASTSKDGHPVLIRIEAKKGTKGIWMGGRSAHPIEREFILDRNMAMKVTGVAREAGGRLVVNVQTS